MVLAYILTAMIMLSIGFNFYMWKEKFIKKKPKAWHLSIYTVEGEEAHEITVPDDVYDAFKVWLRGEGDSLFEIDSEDAYLGLKRAHVVSAKAIRK